MNKINKMKVKKLQKKNQKREKIKQNLIYFLKIKFGNCKIIFS